MNHYLIRSGEGDQPWLDGPFGSGKRRDRMAQQVRESGNGARSPLALNVSEEGEAAVARYGRGLRPLPASREEAMRRWPRLTAHLICHSLGYATPSTAAAIILDVVYGRGNWCEWIASCYRGDPQPAVRMAFQGRHTHRGFMAHYPRAVALVREAIASGKEALFAGWF